jgi:FkbM family methyltransferase
MENYVNFNMPDNITHIKIDVGLGLFNIHSQNWLTTEKNLFVFMFEPNKDSRDSSLYFMNEIDIKGNNNSFQIVPVALSDVSEEKQLEFYSMQNDGGTSSLYKPIASRLGPIQNKNIVPVFSLKHFFDLFPWNKFEYIEYIKIDAQGADLDIIKSAGNYLRERVVFITAEPESTDYENCNHNTCENMESYLLTQNFIRIKHPNTEDPTFFNKKFFELYDKIHIFQSCKNDTGIWKSKPYLKNI